MKNIILALLCSSAAIAQVNDNFNDGNFTQNPSWFGQVNHYEIDSDFWLHLNAPSENSSSLLYLKSHLLENATWEMQTKLDFNPSGSNYLDWYIMANDSNLIDASEAYFVRVGDTEDEVSLYRQKEGEITKIIDGLDGTQSLQQVNVKLKVERKLGGNFVLWHKSADSLDWVNEGATIDNQCLNASYSGLVCNYTSTRSDKFYFDDYTIDGETLIDSLAPLLESHNLISNNQIHLQFAEEDFDNLHTSIFELQNIDLSLDSIQQISDTLKLFYLEEFPTNSSFSLLISNLSDTAGNIMNDTLLNFYQQQHQTFDLVISEIMADPEPSVQLAEVEYIELYNRANYPLNLHKWKLSINQKDYLLDSIIIEPKDYLLLIKPSDTSNYTTQNQLVLNYNSLSNTTGHIALLDSLNKIIHELEYFDTWYGNANKEEGGWSLEMIDTESYCIRENNWSAAVNNLGGSPGFQNSNMDSSSKDAVLSLDNLLVLDDYSIELVWSQNIYDPKLYDLQNYRLSENLEIAKIEHLLNATQIELKSSIVPDRLIQIDLAAIKDCFNNEASYSHTFNKGLWPLPQTVYINEVLFNPDSDGYDYIELYNASASYIELSDLLIGNYDSLFDQISKPKLITEEHRSFAPNAYISLCENIDWLKQHYTEREEQSYVQLASMPSMPDKEGSLALSTRAFEILDFLQYSEEMHFKPLETKEGVALERLSIESNTWYSAPSTTNYGSPSWQNSQKLMPNNNKSLLEVFPEIISPNLDGNEDFTQISIQSESATMAKISIYNKRGFLVWSSSEYDYLTTNKNWLWDGVDLNQSPLPMGLYMIIVELVNQNGATELLKHPIVIYRE